jgi:hypothetical protein
MRLAPIESLPRPLTPTSTGRPACSAARSDCESSGSTLTHQHPVAQPRGLPGHETSAARGDNDRVEATDLILELARHRALPGDGVGVVERVHHQRTGLGMADVGRDLRLVVVPIDHSHRRPKRATLACLIGGDIEGTNTSAAIPSACEHVRHGRRRDSRRWRSRVLRAGSWPARSRSASTRFAAPAGLERTGVLEQLQLEHEVTVVDHGVRRTRPSMRRLARSTSSGVTPASVMTGDGIPNVGTRHRPVPRQRRQH